MIIKKLIGLLRLMRLELPISAGICTIMGQLFALGDLASLKAITTGFMSIFLTSAAILVLNDFFDVETDKINAPNRPIPSGAVTAKQALYFAVLLFIIGLICSLVISISALVVIICLAGIGYLYNRYFKKSGLLGNLLVSFSVGMTFIYGGLTVGNPLAKTVLFFGLIAALIDLGEEISADAMDMEGDKLIDSGSLAIKHGKRAARTVSTAIFSTVICLSLIPLILKWFALIYLIPILIMDISIAVPVLILHKPNVQHERQRIRFIYLGATAGIIIFLVMRVTGL